MKLFLSCFAVVTLCALALPAYAQADADVVFRQHTKVSFGDDIIDGDLAHPDRMAIVAKKRDRHRSLIVARESFRVEILASHP